MSKPIALLLEPEPRIRIRVVAALRGVVDVRVPEDPTEAPVRSLRAVRPDVVLLAMGRGRLAPSLNQCRVLTTDQGSTARVGLTDRWCRLRHPAQALRRCGGHGYLGGVPTDDAIRRFALALIAGQQPVHLAPPEPGLLGRWLGRD